VVAALRDPNQDTARLACCTVANLAEDAENMDKIVDANAIPPLMMTLAQGSPIVQREACRALGNLSANIEYGDMVLRAGAQPPLLILLRADDVVCQRMAAMSLANLTSNLRNQGRMIAEGLLEPIKALCLTALDPKASTDAETVRYALLAVANLAVSHGNHPKLLDTLLPLLAEFAKHRDVRCRQHAVFALGNLCGNHDNLERISAAGCLKTIITYSFPSSDVSVNVQFQAVAGLRGLSCHSAIRTQLVREGALEPLILAAGTDSIEVRTKPKWEEVQQLGRWGEGQRENCEGSDFNGSGRGGLRRVK
jgi:HEAT repeat protein